jgi:alkane 1-monooxygenase
MRSTGFYLVFLIPTLVVVGVLAGGWARGAVVAFVFGAVPLLDAWLGHERRNPGEDIAHARRFDVPLVLWVVTQVAVLMWWITRDMGETIGVALALGTLSVGLMTGGIGITVAHELMHRKSRFERALAEVLMSCVGYAHFCIEHVHGHHRHVATPLDPASSRLGENVYRYLPRTIFGGFASAWSIEAERMTRSGAHVWHWRNRMLRYAAVQLAIYTTLFAALGGLAVALWAAQSVVAIVLLEVINFVEHYGLERRELAPGKYERVQPRHSWNASHRVTNWLLFNLQRHSDHHFLASRPYDVLRHYDDVPQLPAGYATMVLVALVPPLWRRIMDPRVHALREAEPATVLAA